MKEECKLSINTWKVYQFCWTPGRYELNNRPCPHYKIGETLKFWYYKKKGYFYTPLVEVRMSPASKKSNFPIPSKIYITQDPTISPLTLKSMHRETCIKISITALRKPKCK